MDAIGETIENVGLAQEIQTGLSASLQKNIKWAEIQGDIDKKTAELGSMDPWVQFTSDELFKFCMKQWAKANKYDLAQGRRRSSLTGTGVPPKATQAGVQANWDVFKGSDGFVALCKYSAYCDKVKNEPISAKLFHEARPLGKGAFGAVYLVFKKDTGVPMASKKINKYIAKQNHMQKDLLIEREVLSKISSPFCVNLHYAFEDGNDVQLTLTLMPGGDLSFLLQSRYSEAKKKEDRKFTPLSEQSVKFYAASMAMGLEAIHKAGYVYRDLKPQNVLLDADGLVRISDMGLTANISGGPIKQCSGTRGYWSPETIKKEPYTTAPDWWSLGVTIYVLTSDKLPFKGKEDEEKDEATCKGEIEFSHGEPESVQKLISALCTVDTSKRLGCDKGLEDLKAHPYFSGFDWAACEDGEMEAEIKPNPNDINAPSKKEIEAFVNPKGVEWTADDIEKFSGWTYMDANLWKRDEAPFRIKKKKEIAGADGVGGGGGCCVVA